MLPPYSSCEWSELAWLRSYALTLIDSLDSLAVFGRKADFAAAVRYLGKNISFDKGALREKHAESSTLIFATPDILVNVFEVTIRVLGGLLSGHLLASDPKMGLTEENPEFGARVTRGFFCAAVDSYRCTDYVYQNELLTLALDLGDRLLVAFNSPTGIPYSLVRLLSISCSPFQLFNL